jgi:hypothetical protein
VLQILAPFMRGRTRRFRGRSSSFRHLDIELARRQVNGLIWAYERSRIAVVVVGENAEIFIECAFFCQSREWFPQWQKYLGFRH